MGSGRSNDEEGRVMKKGIGDIEIGRVLGWRIGEGVEIWKGMGVRKEKKF